MIFMLVLPCQIKNSLSDSKRTVQKGAILCLISLFFFHSRHHAGVHADPVRNRLSPDQPGQDLHRPFPHLFLILLHMGIGVFPVSGQGTVKTGDFDILRHPKADLAADFPGQHSDIILRRNHHFHVRVGF